MAAQLTSLRIGVDQQNAQAMMVSLKKRLRMGSDAERERQFFTHVLQYLLQYLTTCGERQVELETWMITSYEVEFGPEIGSGGLYVFCVLMPAEYSLIVYLSVAKCSRGSGTTPWWHSRYS